MDLGSPSHLQRERRGEPAAAVGPCHGSRCGKDGSGDGISSPCHCGARSCPWQCGRGWSSCMPHCPTHPLCQRAHPHAHPTHPPLAAACVPCRGGHLLVLFSPPTPSALQAGGAASIFPRVREGQRLFPMVPIGLCLLQIASMREALHYPPHPTPQLAHSLAGMFLCWSDLFTRAAPAAH